MTQPKSPPSKSHGRKAVRPTLTPQPLMTDTPDLHDVWRASVITLFPEMFPGVLGGSLTGRALKDGKWQLDTVHLRDFGEGRHRNVDDTPAGGGAGMVLRADIMGRAIEHALRKGPGPLIYLSPRGRRFDQAMARSLATTPGAIFICGRFEGLDQRVIEHYGITEVSLGDFVMTGGELAAQAVIDATVRLLPGVLGNEASAEEESFSNGLLEHPHYTKPADWHGHKIPDVLLSGHHGEIAKWRQAQSEAITRARRPDLWEAWLAQQG
ncbi:MAG: tRNA (guanosine(37)-N1)-methyltransferase TrmD [Marinovum algicola]|jgi:tRNA (guanine37-N1)-methyltransferase|uniref:tRNA (guanine-N(1)-)-methyltransferase n=1 Tax=Marinovum algicola TaxID=42444 RepID=A0A975W6H7_9RHOB|nr:tRNA (guanosine(37)-N1)-methyltransferase TrmD [Marinovum algicola]SEI60157.1 tRNA (Guanine37-N(1)-) methyltransferase [Marinovum algicola]SLN26494.1 tRNA (guanine-N(1)-)-methyltransferase [Marinovum algicola]